MDIMYAIKLIIIVGFYAACCVFAVQFLCIVITVISASGPSSVHLGSFKDQTHFSVDLRDLKRKPRWWYGRQYLYITFTESSGLNIFSRPDNTMDVQQEPLRINEFMQGLEVHSIKNISATDVNGNDLKVSLSTSRSALCGFTIDLFDGDSVISNISFELTTPASIDIDYRFGFIAA